MECAKDEIFNIRYNTELNRLEMRKKNRIKSFSEVIKKHKLISMCVTALIVFSCLNFFLIYNFMKVLQNV